MEKNSCGIENLYKLNEGLYDRVVFTNHVMAYLGGSEVFDQKKAGRTRTRIFHIGRVTVSHDLDLARKYPVRISLIGFPEDREMVKRELVEPRRYSKISITQSKLLYEGDNVGLYGKEDFDNLVGELNGVKVHYSTEVTRGLISNIGVLHVEGAAARFLMRSESGDPLDEIFRGVPLEVIVFGSEGMERVGMKIQNEITQFKTEELFFENSEDCIEEAV